MNKLPDPPGDLVAKLLAEAAEARERARIYYELADTRDSRGEIDRAEACCDLGRIATDKAIALEAEAARLSGADRPEAPGSDGRPAKV